MRRIAYLEDAGSGEVIMKNSCKFKPQLKNCNSFGTTTMFYVNSSSGNTLEPKPTKATSEATTLIGLLQKISSKFKKVKLFADSLASYFLDLLQIRYKVRGRLPSRNDKKLGLPKYNSNSSKLLEQK
ncbi:hypothetical protein Tco_0962954 [Tanacetum coccineum]